MNICQNLKCSTPFTAKQNSKGLYCSRSCSAVVNNSKHPKRPLGGICQECKGPAPTAKNYCSDECKLKYRHNNGMLARIHCHCGEPVAESGFCRIHYNERMKLYMTERYHRRRSEWISSKGGKCVQCGTTDKLEIDHIDPLEKTYNIGTILSGGSEQKVQDELAKCQVLCYDCHKAKTSNDLGAPHGGGVSGKKNCTCELCRARKAEYMRERRKTETNPCGYTLAAMREAF